MVDVRTIAVGSDDAGYLCKEVRKVDLPNDPRIVSGDVGVDCAGQTEYPHVVVDASRRVAEGSVDRALLIYRARPRVAIAARKVQGVRAVTAHDSYSVERSVLSNNPPVLTTGQRVVGLELGRRQLKDGLGSRFDKTSPSAAKVAEINEYEGAR